MQVIVHSIDRTRVVDFTSEEKRSVESPPFVAIEIHDGKGSQVDFLLRDKEDVVKLAEAVKNALGMFYRMQEQSLVS